MNRESREALNRINAEPRSPESRNAGGNFAPAQRGGLNGVAARNLHARIRRHVKAAMADPSLLGWSYVGAMMADHHEASAYLKWAWAIVRRRLAATNNGGAGDADGLKGVEVLRELAPLVDDLRRWAKLNADTAVRIGEVQARLQGAGDSLEERYGAGASRRDGGPEIPPDAEEAEVLEDEGAGPGESPHGATSPAEPEAPPDAA